MGVYHLIVNPDKRQFIDASPFGEASKHHSVLVGYHGMAVAMLVTSNAHYWNDLAGTWQGDKIIAAGSLGAPLDHGIETGTPEHPDRTLYTMADEEYEDISYKAIAMVSEADYEIAVDLVSKAEDYETSPLARKRLVDMYRVTLEVEASNLEQALEELLGEDWEGICKRVNQGEEWKFWQRR